MDSLEARSRDVQERTFCKWFLTSPFTLTFHPNITHQAEHETRIAWVSTNDLSRQGPVGRCSAYSVDGEALLHLSGVFSHTRQEIMGMYHSLSVGWCAPNAQRS